jgi:hypothetical protein
MVPLLCNEKTLTPKPHSEKPSILFRKNFNEKMKSFPNFLKHISY